MAVNSLGCLWIVFFGGWRIARFSPQGKPMGGVRFPCANITKLVFGGDDLLRQPLVRGLFSFRTPSSGLTQHRCKPESPGLGA